MCQPTQAHRCKSWEFYELFIFFSYSIMAIITSRFVCKSGLTVENPYISLNHNCIYLHKEIDRNGVAAYICKCVFGVYLNRSAYDKKFPPIEDIHVEIQTDNLQNIGTYPLMYNELKKKVIDYIDA